MISDSKYVTDAFNKHWIDGWLKKNWKGASGPVKNVDLWKRLLKAAEQHKITFTWVKGHNGHPENERCDQLATTAADGTDLMIDEGLQYESFLDITDILQCITPFKIVFTIIRFCDNVSLES